MPALRQQQTAQWAATLTPPVLRQVDEQTLAALAAVAQARNYPGFQSVESTGWGVLAAPRFFGRAAMVASLERTRTDGPWGVSPQFVPHRSLHSLSGLLSLGLKTQGPNLGIGGGPDGETEALLTALIWLHANHVPGVWVVLTGWYPEPTLSPQGQPQSDTICHAAALALSQERGVGMLQMRIGGSGTTDSACPSAAGHFSVESVYQALAQTAPGAAACSWQLTCGSATLDWPVGEEAHG